MGKQRETTGPSLSGGNRMVILFEKDFRPPQGLLIAWKKIKGNMVAVTASAAPVRRRIVEGTLQELHQASLVVHVAPHFFLLGPPYGRNFPDLVHVRGVVLCCGRRIPP